MDAANETDIDKLTKARDKLIDRLDIGAIKINQARNEGKDVSSWEDLWLELYQRYNDISDQLAAMHNTTTTTS